MCGIAGLVDVKASTPESTLRARISAMAATMRHRGPDGRGSWVDAAAGVALGHERLAVVDLSAAGAQPMTSADGRYAVVFNGEIYNHWRVRSETAGYPFRGRSDTETLVAAISAWGVERAAISINGMFAFAVWDRHSRELWLARDRVGEKPLIVARGERWLAFASEVRAIERCPEVPLTIDRHSLSLYFKHNYIPGPQTIYHEATKVLPGQLIKVVTDGSVLHVRPKTYWSLPRPSTARTAPTGLENDVQHLDSLLRASVKDRMASDVPLGAFLSGGVDSTIVVALMQTQSSSPVRTFTVSMEERTHDESDRAAAVANYLGTDHTEIRLTAEEAIRRVPHLAEKWDEPFADPSQLPTLLMAEQARRHVTVALTGDGGDEIFGGYNRYVYGAQLWRIQRRLPRRLSQYVSALIHAAATYRSFDRLGGASGPLPPSLPDKLAKIARLLGTRDYAEFRSHLLQSWQEPPIVDGRDFVSSSPDGNAKLADGVIHDLMRHDMAFTLPDEMLVKVDRASMAASLEARVPLLDPSVVEFAARLPLDRKIVGLQGKVILKQLLKRYVPRSLVDRPKMGFDPPIASWLRGPLRTWADDLLDPSSLRRDPLLLSEPITSAWRQHKRGERNWDYALWSVLMFRGWQESQDSRARAVRSVA